MRKIITKIQRFFKRITFFPYNQNVLCCGLAGIISFKNQKKLEKIDVKFLCDSIEKIERNDFASYKSEWIESLSQAVCKLKNDRLFYEIFTNKTIQNQLADIILRLQTIINTEEKKFYESMGTMKISDVDAISAKIEKLKDIAWCLKSEISDNVIKINYLCIFDKSCNFSHLTIFKKINAVLNSIDRLEVRGRDSAGISLMFTLDKNDFEKFEKTVADKNHLDELKKRSSFQILANMNIAIHETSDISVTVAFVYKIAAEIGKLGDNIDFLREQIKNDNILQNLVDFPHKHYSIESHTRWASVGEISESNCHPVDNKIEKSSQKNGIIHVCLNGDIDNYSALKDEYEKTTTAIPKGITTDTKIIPLQIEKYIKQGLDIEEAFRSAVNDFKGSHAIAMHTNLAPDKMFIAQKGSGQAVFVGLAEDHYMPASEVYGFIEETSNYIKMNGETQGQIFILNQQSEGGIDGIKAMFYDGTPVELTQDDIKHTDITSRDIDRQNFPHYFLKEISEAPSSVEKTLQNRWKIQQYSDKQYTVTLDETTFPKSLKTAFSNGQIQRIFFVGQGTAGVAALVGANILNYYIDDPLFRIAALKASELSGSEFDEHDDERSMVDTLIIAISQSGTTTDTNRAVEMAKERGAYTLAIVNRRDSDITFKVNGVMYTSSGRDVEMSVASTKAFYSQIVAGAILSLNIAELAKRRNKEFISQEIKQLLKLPSEMRKILAMKDEIKQSAERLAVARTYWAVVGSGPNKASANEIRIKLSELCYKTISSDYIEDKKHIDLSSEPLIIVCAAGAKDSVVGDIIKDTAIFQAHKALPVVIADEGEHGFDAYAENVFYVPVVSQHFAPIVNALAGHIWGYYAALAINEGSKFMHDFREEIQNTISDYTQKGMDVYEVILEKSFREKIARFHAEFRKQKSQNLFPSIMGFETAVDLTLTLKYLSGRLPVSDFELDFGVKGTPVNMLDKLFECLGNAVNNMARPVDAIKHQAKTVTVGTSRISEKMEGILFDQLTLHNFKLSQLINRNIMVLKNLQGIVSKINGAILYKIGGLSLLGDLADETIIEIVKKEGALGNIPSRVEENIRLKGTKRTIVRNGNVYIGKGRKDSRSIIVIPILSLSEDAPNIIEHLLLLNISFAPDISLDAKIKALGGKYDNIKNIVQENSVDWNDKYLEIVEISELFGKSAEKIGEFIVNSATKTT